MEKLSQLPLPQKKPVVSDDTTTSAHGSRSVSESARGRASSSRTSSASCNSPSPSLIGGCRSPRSRRPLTDDYVSYAGSRCSSNASPVVGEISSVGIGGRIVETSSWGDCTPELSRRLIDEVGNRKSPLNVREKKSKSSARKNESSHSSRTDITSENDTAVALTHKMTNADQYQARKSAAATSSLKPNELNCCDETHSDSDATIANSNNKRISNIEKSFNGLHRNYDEVITCQQMTGVTSFQTEQRPANRMHNGSRSGDFSSPLKTFVGDPLKPGYDQCPGPGSAGGSPIYHELDPPVSSDSDGVYRFPQAGTVLQHTYQSIAEISEELNALRSKSSSADGGVNGASKQQVNNSINSHKSKNVDQIATGSRKTTKKSQPFRSNRDPLSPGPLSTASGRIVNKMTTLPRAKSVQDLGVIDPVTPALATTTSATDSPVQKATPKLSIFSRIRFSKKSSSNASATASVKNGGSRAAAAAKSNTLPASVGTPSSVVRASTVDCRPTSVENNTSNSRDDPSFSTFTTGRTSMAQRQRHAPVDVTDRSAPTDGLSYSVVYVPHRALVPPPPRNSSLSPSSDCRRVRQLRDNYGTRSSARDGPSPAGVQLSVIPSSASTSRVSPSCSASGLSEPLYRQKFLKIASVNAALHCDNSSSDQPGLLQLQNSSSLGNLPLVSSTLHNGMTRSPLNGPSTGGGIYSRRTTSGVSTTPDVASLRQLTELTSSGNGNFTSGDWSANTSFSYNTHGIDDVTRQDYYGGDNTPNRVRDSGVQRVASGLAVTGLSPSRIGSFTRPSCGVRMAEMRGVARRLTVPGGDTGATLCRSPSCSVVDSPACSSPRWLTSNHAPTPIPSPGISSTGGSKLLPIFQFHFPPETPPDNPLSPSVVREYRNQSSQTQITLGPCAEVKSRGTTHGAASSTNALSGRRQMQTIEEESSPETPVFDEPSSPAITSSLTDDIKCDIDGDVTTDRTSLPETEDSSSSAETERSSVSTAVCSTSSDRSAGLQLHSVPPTSSSSSSKSANAVPDSNVETAVSKSRLKHPSPSLLVTPKSPADCRVSRRSLSACDSSTSDASINRTSQLQRPATAVGSTTPSASRRRTGLGVESPGGTESSHRRLSTGSRRLSRSPAGVSPRTDNPAENFVSSPVIGSRLRNGAGGVTTGSGLATPVSVRGHASSADKRKRTKDESTTNSLQCGSKLQPSDVTCNVTDDHLSIATTDSTEVASTTRSRVAAWSKFTSTACSSLSSSSTGSLASADSDPDATTGPPPSSSSHHVSQTSHVDQATTSVNDEQCLRESRLTTALLRVEQGVLSEKTRMLLARISVARSAQNGQDIGGPLTNITNS